MVIVSQNLSRHRWNSYDNLLLAAAIFIDISDFLPFNVPTSTIQALFLMYVGVSPAKSILVSLINLVPVLNLFPWCTLAVLHAKFGVQLGWLSKLFIEEKPHHVHETLSS